MIYIVDIIDLPKEIENGAEIIIISNNNTVAIIRSSNPIRYISNHTEEELTVLIGESIFVQPCINCGDI